MTLGYVNYVTNSNITPTLFNHTIQLSSAEGSSSTNEYDTTVVSQHLKLNH